MILWEKIIWAHITAKIKHQAKYSLHKDGFRNIKEAIKTISHQILSLCFVVKKLTACNRKFES